MTDTTATPGTETVAEQTTETTAAASASAQTETQAADTGTLIDSAQTAPDKVATAPADFPTDWREKLANGDAKELEQLKRLGSPVDLWKKARSLEQKLSSGEYKRDVPKPEKPEELKAWLAERGIPEAPDGYKIELPSGVVLGEADKPLVDSFTKAAHSLNWDNAKVNEALSWYYAEQERIQAARAEADHENKQRAEDALRSEFGQEYRANLTAVNNLVAGMPENLGGNLLQGRMADGTRVGDHPEIIKWLANISRELNPAATLLPAAAGNPGKGLADRIADIEKMMGDHGSDYWRGPKSDALQSEYRSLIEARDRINSRTAA